MNSANHHEKISRAEFLRLAGINKHELDYLVDCGIVQKFLCHPLARKGKYFARQAQAVREGRPVPRVEWPIQKPAHSRHA